MKETIMINKKNVTVTFSGHYDSELGDFLFLQVMCDVYMPGNQIVPIQVEKEQIKRIVEGFKKRKALYSEINKELIKGKQVYLITPKMRYDLDWMAEQPKLPASKDAQGNVIPAARVSAEYIITELDELNDLETQHEPEQPLFTDKRRTFLLSKGFIFNPVTRNWETKDIRFPDSKVDKSESDEEFEQATIRLLNASYQNHLKRRKPAAKSTDTDSSHTEG